VQATHVVVTKAQRTQSSSLLILHCALLPLLSSPVPLKEKTAAAVAAAAAKPQKWRHHREESGGGGLYPLQQQAGGPHSKPCSGDLIIRSLLFTTRTATSLKAMKARRKAAAATRERLRQQVHALARPPRNRVTTVPLLQEMVAASNNAERQCPKGQLQRLNKVRFQSKSTSVCLCP
jgi:hypothetical protein